MSPHFWASTGYHFCIYILGKFWTEPIWNRCTKSKEMNRGARTFWRTKQPYHLTKHFHIVIFEVSLIKNVKKAARINTKQLQQQYSIKKPFRWCAELLSWIKLIKHKYRVEIWSGWIEKRKENTCNGQWNYLQCSYVCMLLGLIMPGDAIED